jgi:hypothetical protein
MRCHPGVVLRYLNLKDVECPVQTPSLQLLLHLMNESKDLLFQRPGRESLWCYRRNLLILVRNSLKSENIKVVDLSYDISNILQLKHVVDRHLVRYY